MKISVEIKPPLFSFKRKKNKGPYYNKIPILGTTPIYWHIKIDRNRHDRMYQVAYINRCKNVSPIEEFLGTAFKVKIFLQTKIEDMGLSPLLVQIGKNSKISKNLKVAGI